MCMDDRARRAARIRNKWVGYKCHRHTVTKGMVGQCDMQQARAGTLYTRQMEFHVRSRTAASCSAVGALDGMAGDVLRASERCCC